MALERDAGIRNMKPMNSYSINQSRRGGNVRAAQTRMSLADSYTRIREGRGTDSDIKHCVANSKREWKRQRALALELGIADIDTMSEDELQRIISEAEELEYQYFQANDRINLVAARKRVFALGYVDGAIWHREFIARHK